jgi:hypothetical protein
MPLVAERAFDKDQSYSCCRCNKCRMAILYHPTSSTGQTVNNAQPVSEFSTRVYAVHVCRLRVWLCRIRQTCQTTQTRHGLPRKLSSSRPTLTTDHLYGQASSRHLLLLSHPKVAPPPLSLPRVRLQSAPDLPSLLHAHRTRVPPPRPVTQTRARMANQAMVSSQDPEGPRRRRVQSRSDSTTTRASLSAR